MNKEQTAGERIYGYLDLASAFVLDDIISTSIEKPSNEDFEDEYPIIFVAKSDYGDVDYHITKEDLESAVKIGHFSWTVPTDEDDVKLELLFTMEQAAELMKEGLDNLGS